MNNNNNQQQQQQQQNMQMGTGLTRYRSAPSSYFATLLNTPTNDAVFGGDDFDHLFSTRASSPEAPRVFPGFSNSTEGVRQNASMNPPQFLPKVEAREVHQPQQSLQRQRSSDYSSGSQVMFSSEAVDSSSAAVDNSFGGLFGSFGANQTKMERGVGGGGSSLVRHSSSPAGLFANIDIENEFGPMRAMGNYGGGSSANAEATSSSSSRFKSQMDFSSRRSSSGMMNPIPEVDIKGMDENIAGNRRFDENRGSDVDYITGLPMNTWDDSDNFLRGLADNENRKFSNANPSDDPNNEGGSRTATRLSHHLSLPSSSTELSAMLQDSVPCKLRAKRGFATHPRSIAERVRRTKISERIRKLQELVPNMEKQTNTSVMLDLAVDYIKDLQKQLKTLSDNRAKCSCSSATQIP